MIFGWVISITIAPQTVFEKTKAKIKQDGSLYRWMDYLLLLKRPDIPKKNKAAETGSSGYGGWVSEKDFLININDEGNNRMKTTEQLLQLLCCFYLFEKNY